MEKNKIIGCTWILFSIKEKKILMMKRDKKPSIPYPGKWVFPGGTAEKEESVERCLFREIQEELGYRPSPENIRKIFVLFYPSGKAEEHFYFIPVKEIPELKINEGEKIEWFRLEEIEKLDLGFWCREVIPFLRRYISEQSLSSR
ncbi:NUDIX domain-containing protein [bacterium]|nr:NUDIX domain-containing protein [bacterium]